MTYDTKTPFGFEALELYKAARTFRKRIYELAGTLPVEEKFALQKQMIRAAVSLTNNIAEGHGRYNWQDNTRFCRQARGSLYELVDDVNVCHDQKYADWELLGNLRSDAVELLKLLNGYIAYLQRQRQASR